MPKSTGSSWPNKSWPGPSSSITASITSPFHLLHSTFLHCSTKMAAFFPASLMVLFLGIHQIAGSPPPPPPPPPALPSLPDIAVQMTLAVMVNGTPLDLSGAKAVAKAILDGSLPQNIPLLDAVPPSLQGMLPPDLAAALKNMTVADLKSEMSAALEAIKNAKTPQELMDMLAKAMPKTLEVLKQIMKAIMPMLEALMQKIKDAFNALSDAAKKFLTELAQKVKDAAMALMEQLKKMLEKMGMDIKANLQAAITAAIPMAQMLFDLPMVKASLQITMSSG